MRHKLGFIGFFLTFFLPNDNIVEIKIATLIQKGVN